MPKLDDDEDEKAWADNSKFDGKTTEDPSAKSLPALVQGFVHHVCSKKNFKGRILAFLAERCKPFEDAEVGAPAHLSIEKANKSVFFTLECGSPRAIWDRALLTWVST